MHRSGAHAETRTTSGVKAAAERHFGQPATSTERVVAPQILHAGGRPIGTVKRGVSPGRPGGTAPPLTTGVQRLPPPVPGRGVGVPLRPIGGHGPVIGPHHPLPVRSPTGQGYVYQGHRFPPFHVPPYHWPPGHGYHPYGLGMRLPAVYLNPNYVIRNYADYGLDAPPPGDEWVRYGPDLLDVDPDDGQVVGAVDNAFDQTAPDEGELPQNDMAAPPDEAGAPSAADQGLSADYVGADPVAEANAGIQALDGGDPVRATRLLTRAIKSGRLNPADQEVAYLKCGEAYVRLHDYSRAEENLKQAHRLNPDDKEAADLLAEVQTNSPWHYLPYMLGAVVLGILATIGGLSIFNGIRRRPAPTPVSSSPSRLNLGEGAEAAPGARPSL